MGETPQDGVVGGVQCLNSVSSLAVGENSKSLFGQRDVDTTMKSVSIEMYYACIDHRYA